MFGDERIAGRALEDDAVVGEEEGALGRQQVEAGRTAGAALLAAVRQQVDAHALRHHQLLAVQQRRRQDLQPESNERQFGNVAPPNRPQVPTSPSWRF